MLALTLRFDVEWLMLSFAVGNFFLTIHLCRDTCQNAPMGESVIFYISLQTTYIY